MSQTQNNAKKTLAWAFSSQLQSGKAASLSLVWHWFGERGRSWRGGEGVGVVGGWDSESARGGTGGGGAWARECGWAGIRR